MKTVEERLLKHTEKTDTCWNWTACKDHKGYGIIRIDGKNRATHRVSYELFKGKIPKGKGYHGTCVLHSCDNPGCINPEHLRLGTNRENILDMIQKGRNVVLRGKLCHKAKLTEKQVLEIREKFIPYVYTTIMLAKEYGVDPSTIGHMIKRRIWKHI